MSGMRHATISAWQRHEDGSYAAEIEGWALRVKWHPESAEAHRGFSWQAEHEGQKLVSQEISEEIEVAMAHAEEQAEHARAAQKAAAPHASQTSQTSQTKDEHEGGGRGHH